MRNHELRDGPGTRGAARLAAVGNTSVDSNAAATSARDTSGLIDCVRTPISAITTVGAD